MIRFRLVLAVAAMAAMLAAASVPALAQAPLDSLNNTNDLGNNLNDNLDNNLNNDSLDTCNNLLGDNTLGGFSLADKILGDIFGFGNTNFNDCSLANGLNNDGNGFNSNGNGSLFSGVGNTSDSGDLNPSFSTS